MSLQSKKVFDKSPKISKYCSKDVPRRKFIGPRKKKTGIPA